MVQTTRRSRCDGLRHTRNHYHNSRNGFTLGPITIGEEYDADQDEAFSDPASLNLVKEASIKGPFHVASSGSLHIALLDCGVKEGILRCLAQRGANVTV